MKSLQVRKPMSRLMALRGENAATVEDAALEQEVNKNNKCLWFSILEQYCIFLR